MISCSDEAIGELSHTASESVLGTWNEFVWVGIDWIGLDEDYTSWLVLFIPMFFGAVHLGSWNFSLPSEPELWMWRASALFCVAVTPTFSLLMFMNVMFAWGDEAENSILVGSLLLYAIVRLFMIVEVFFSLRALPQSAYGSIQWSSFIPHI